MPTDQSRLAELQHRLGYQFRDAALLRCALTHPSYLQDDPAAGPGNQRLEFLGDSVLLLLLSEKLFQLFPDEREGALSKRRAMISQGQFLSRLARELGLEAALLLGRSEEQTGGRARASILEDAFEALVGAVYLDSDFATVRRVVLAWYGPLADRLASMQSEDNPKGRLQELVHPIHGNRALRYEVVNATGEDHKREYEVNVYLHDRLLGSGRGTSKRLAEAAAARTALTSPAARAALASTAVAPHPPS